MGGGGTHTHTHTGPGARVEGSETKSLEGNRVPTSPQGAPHKKAAAPPPASTNPLYTEGGISTQDENVEALPAEQK